MDNTSKSIASIYRKLEVGIKRGKPRKQTVARCGKPVWLNVTREEGRALLRAATPLKRCTLE